MTTSEAILKLKAEAANNPVAYAVFKMWSERKRTRHQVTVAALKQRMDSMGHNYTKGEYTHLLVILANLGFGKLVTGPKGRVIGIKGIDLTLQSMGSAAVSGSVKPGLKTQTPRNRFRKLATNEEVLNRVWDAPSIDSAIHLAFSINGKLVNIDVPKEFTAEELASLVARIKERRLVQR